MLTFSVQPLLLSEHKALKRIAQRKICASCYLLSLAVCLCIGLIALRGGFKL
jgi:small subunit ribosomal protein S7